MLNNTLNTNEVKNAAGAEVEFQHLEFPPGRKRVFAVIGENPSQTHRLSISHEEIGTGVKMRRRSVIRLDKKSISSVDSVTPVTTLVYTVIDSPVGAMTTNTVLTDLLANMISFLASTGADTTIKYDGTGTGAQVLINGSL